MGLYAIGNHIRSEPETEAPDSRYHFEDCRTCSFHDNGWLYKGSFCSECKQADMYQPAGLNDVRNRPEDRPEVTTTQSKYKTMKKAFPKEKPQTFDSIIMECQDTLSIETEIDKRFKEWVKGENDSDKISGTPIVKAIAYASSWLFSATVGTRLIIIAIAEYQGIKIGALILLSGIALLVSSVFLFSKTWNTVKKLSIRDWISSKKKSKRNPSEASKFEFLRTAYVGTIDKLNNRLFSVKDKIDQQIKEHEKDELEILNYQDLFDDITEPTQKIKEAIQSLKDSREKISEKQKEINDVLNEYTGENGYISQKEKEIKRIQKAQEISDRMKHNFKTTLEITARVDLFSDMVVPGIKRLMSLEIPKLIEKVNHECDRSKSYLEISA